MRVLVIGLDNCGCRIAGEFIELNRRAKSERRVNIVLLTLGELIVMCKEK